MRHRPFDRLRRRIAVLLAVLSVYGGGSGFRRDAAVHADPRRPSLLFDSRVLARSFSDGGRDLDGTEPKFDGLPSPAFSYCVCDLNI